jgi:hypothetical protein
VLLSITDKEERWQKAVFWVFDAPNETSKTYEVM